VAVDQADHYTVMVETAEEMLMEAVDLELHIAELL
jgi:hypothetical protein